MSVLKIRAKVIEPSEQDMEIESSYDMGTIAKSSKWVWRNLAIGAENIYTITEYSTGKCVIETIYDEKILVMESFTSLYPRWEKQRDTLANEEEINEEGEENSGDEED